MAICSFLIIVQYNRMYNIKIIIQYIFVASYLTNHTHRDGLNFYFTFTSSFHITVTAVHYSLQTALSEPLALMLHGPQRAIFNLID